MSIKGLIKNQTILIDDHKRGIGEVKEWDKSDIDVHIDKSTNFKVNGVRHKVRIRIPINSDLGISIDKINSKEIEIPSQLQKEINDAFNNKKIRERFVAELIDVLKNFKTILTNEERVRSILERLSKHFDLEWTERKIATYANDILQKYTEIYIDDQGEEYFITVEKDKIKIGQNNGYSGAPDEIKRNNYR